MSNKTFIEKLIAAACVLAAASGCGRSPSRTAPTVMRLVDQLKPESIAGGSSTQRDLPRTEWRFDAPSKDKWDAGPGVAGLAVRDGHLAGRTTSAFPLIHVQRTSGLDNQDIVHAIELRMRVS